MKISSRVDGSVCAVLSNRPSASLRTTTARRSLCTARDVGREPQKRKPGRQFFCARSSLWLLSTFTPTAETRRPVRIPRPRDASQTYSTAAAAAKPAFQAPPPPPIHDKEHLMSYVRQEGAGSVHEHLDFYEDPYRRGYAQADGPRLQVSDKRRDVEYPSRDETFKINDETRQLIGKLCQAISYRLRHPNRSNLEPIYKLYLQLPEPRMLYLTWNWRDRLLKVMGTPPKRDSESMLRYFALVADVKNAGLTLRRTHWNLALAFATKYAARATATEVESALRLWREMERGARIKGNDVTFNVLFDVASKAGNFTLADMIYKEMEARGIAYNRYHHVSLIHYFGLKLDSEGIRATYKEMVEAGEMVDTIVLNCVISGLLRCGEESAAEETYERMKTGNNTLPFLPERNYTMGRVITKVLMMFTKVGKQHPEMQKSLQQNVHLAPNLHTYKLFVEHYAITVGDLGKVAQYLDEMKHLKITIHPTVFLALFKGFYAHGGFPSSEWSEKRLEGVLMALYQAKDERVKGFRIDRWLVIWALRAVNKCSSQEAVVRTFDAMAERWDIPPDRHPFMHSLLDNITNGGDLKSSTGKWDGPSNRRYKKDGSRL
ncbi:Fc.00g008970.m01.CDS01 [Cosmosporella sp. VM-42]